MRPLVTGGTGRLGSVVTAQLLGPGHGVVVLDDPSTGHRGSYDGVLHFAARAVVNEARTHGLAADGVRYFDVGAAYGRLGERHEPDTHLVPNVLQVPARRRDSVQAPGSE